MTHRPHRRLIGLILLLATAAATAAIGVRWINGQILSPTGWSRTSTRLIADRAVRHAVAGFSVDQAFGAAGIDHAIAAALPGPIASEANGELHHAAAGAADSLLSGRAGRGAWQRASRQAHANLLTAVAHPNRRQGVTLDLTPLLRDVVGSIAGGGLARRIPGSAELLAVRSPTAGRLVVLHPGQLRALRVGVRTAQTLDWALPLITLGLFTLALLLGYGWRARVLSRIGFSLALAGAIALGLRAVLQYPLSTAFVGSAVDRAAVRAAWLIGTTELRTLAIEVLIAGAILAVVGWAARWG